MPSKIIEVVEFQLNGSTQIGKECTKCKRLKPLTDYHRQVKGTAGRRSMCKECVARNSSNKHGRPRKKLIEIEVNGEMVKVKPCDKCMQFIPITSEYFHKKKESWDGLSSRCKNCVNAVKKKWKKENKERAQKQSKIYYQNNKEKLLAYAKKWHANNIETLKEKRKKYHKSPSGQESYARRQHRRRTAEEEALSTLTKEQWKSCKEHFDNRCAYCNKKSKITLDHFHPVSKGGELTYCNVIPCCQSCNSSKRDKLFTDWYPHQEFYSQQREKRILAYLGYKNNQQQIALF